MADNIDVLMKVVVTSGGLAMEGESMTDFLPLVRGDTMITDFKPGHFCELREFDFSAGAEDSLSKSKSKDKKTAEPVTMVSAKGAHVAQMVARMERVERRAQGDFVDMREVGYERIMDSASPLLFNALTGCTTLASITIVKRKGTGSKVSGLGYLRLDFEDVLLTKLEWEDSEHVMMESGKFIYRKLTLKYLSQEHDGTLIPGSSASWQMKATR